jgi:hypothetical protein
MLFCSNPVRVLRVRAEADAPEMGVKAGEMIYLVRDEAASNGPAARFRIVTWAATRWTCSCGKGKCEHKRLVNDWLFAQSQEQQGANADLWAHVADELQAERQ